MIYIPITVDFEEKEFDSFLEKEQIELYFTTDDNGTIVHNFQDWSFLKKFKKLKILKLNQAEILKKFSNNFFTNLYSMDKLEKLIIEYTMISLPDEPLPKNLYPKNFKEYEIKFDSKYLPSDTFEPNKGEDYKDYEGIGDIDDLERIYEWFTYGIPQLYDFPNIEKFKKLEILNFYNIFDTDSFQGHLFEIDNSLFYKKIDIIKSLLKKANVKNINIFGLNLNNNKIYYEEIAKDDASGKSFVYFESDIFYSIVELYNIKKIKFNNEDPLKYLKRYYRASNLKEITNLAITSGIPKGVKNFTLGEEGTIQIKMKV
jgi:hypothetical protein